MNLDKTSFNEVNQMDQKSFEQLLEGIYEHSPWIVQRAYALKPFKDIDDLATRMQNIVLNASTEEQLNLIRAHPELAGKAAIKKELTVDSNREQSGAGLDQCSPEEFEKLSYLNTAYNRKFGFPFILAVKGHNRLSIIEAFSERLNNPYDVEFRECIYQIGLIAKFRLINLFP
jgi:2-oxo-4-hydroxy-4-carboxy-5-ureidoimidazoline decarboxylase